MPDSPQSPLSPDSAKAQYSWRFANAQYNEAKSELLVAGQPVPTEPRPLRLLAELLHHTNEVVTKSELFEAVWEGRVTVDNVLANAVTKLKKALGEEAGARIVNVPRVGYKLLGPVERTVVGAVAPALLTFQVGMPVPSRPHFVLVRPLGHTGRGNVWLAQQNKTKQQRVFKFAATAEGLRQLKREFTLFRLLRAELGERRDFVALLDANFSESPFWLESEYGGEDLAQWAQADDRLKTMAMSERLALFIAIVQALADAHRVGVLHKDLKPANVLISGAAPAWHVQLIDFGSGRALDPQQLAQLGLTAMGLTTTHAVAPDANSGTPLYLAPEVLAGQPSTVQSDVYALGVMMYQLLVADFRHVLATGWEADIADLLLQQDIATATHGRPKERLASAAELLQRLETLELRREAQQQAKAERAQQLALQADWLRRKQRRPWAVAGVLSLVLGVAASLWFYASASQAAQQALVEAARAQQVSEFLHRDVLEAPDVVTANRARPIQMLEVLRKASASAAERFAKDPLTEAIVHRRLAQTYLRLASLNDASMELKRAVTLFADLVPADHSELLTARFLQVWLYAWAERQTLAWKVLAEAEKIAGPLRLSEASELAYVALRGRLEAMFQAKQFDAAVPIGDRLVAVADSLYPVGHNLRLDARVKLMELHQNLGHVQQVDAISVEISGPPHNAKDAKVEVQTRQYTFTGDALLAQMHAEEAATAFAAARKVLLSGQQVNEFYLAFLEFHDGRTQNALGQPAQALANFDRAQALFLRTMGEGHVYISLTQINAVQAMLQLNQSAKAAAALAAVREWYFKHVGGTRNAQAEWLHAMAMNQLGKHQEALEFVNGLSLEKLVDGGMSREAALFRTELERARAHHGLGQVVQAREIVRGLWAEDRATKVWPWELEQARRLQKRLGS